MNQERKGVIGVICPKTKDHRCKNQSACILIGPCLKDLTLFQRTRQPQAVEDPCAETSLKILSVDFEGWNKD